MFTTTTAALALGVSAFAAPTDVDTYPVYISSEKLLDLTVMDANGMREEIRDIVVDESGAIHEVIFESGAVGSFEQLRWDADGKTFRARTPDELDAYRAKRKQEMHSYGNAWRINDSKRGMHDSKGSKDGVKRHQEPCKMMLSTIVGLDIHDATTNDEALGSVGGAFIDARSGSLAYLTTSIGGVLGIGAESKVVPLDAVQFNRLDDGEFILTSNLTKSRLERAPTLGDGSESLDNPPYRDSLYSYFGVDRAPYDPRESTEDRSGIVTLAKVIGATVVKTANGEPVVQQDTDDEENTRVRDRFGMRRKGENEDSIANLVLDLESGNVNDVLLESGAVVPIASLKWNAEEECFYLNESQLTDSSTAGRAGDQGRLLASSVADMTVLANDGSSVSGVEDLYFNTQERKLAYVTVDHDGVRVLPWSLIDVKSANASKELTVKLPKSALANAPELDGSVGASLYSPVFRERVAKMTTQR